MIDKGLIARLEGVLNSEFVRLPYTEGIRILQEAVQNGKKFEFPCEWGDDLASEHERFLVEEHFKKPVIMTNYPKAIKAFYMKIDAEESGFGGKSGQTVQGTDVLFPKFLKKKVYHVFLDKNVTAHDMQQIAEGIELEDGEIHADAIEYASDTDKSQVGIEIHSGKNRIVRRIFEHLGYRVVKLDRVQFAGLTKKNLRRGDWRFLTEKEVEMLRMGAFE